MADPHDPHDQHEHSEPPANLTPEAKLVKRIEHWIHHNSDHADTYRQWADEARRLDHPEVARLLEDVTAKTLEINRKFEQALAVFGNADTSSA